jgi:mRNA-degrading endonuclease toxin of MazEF toxin-antitoxin module
MAGHREPPILPGRGQADSRLCLGEHLRSRRRLPRFINWGLHVPKVAKDLGLAAKTRPVIIVSRQDPDPPRSLVLYVPLTTQQRNSPYEVPLPRLPFLDRESVANVQGLGPCQQCALNVRSAFSPRREWSGSRTRWLLPWI